MQCVAPDPVATVRNRVLMEGPVLEQLPCKNYSLCYSSAFNFEQFDSSSHPATKFRNEIFNTIFPLKFMSVECYHSSELKRILISNKFF
jgi:hypothetical protein